MNLLFGNDPLLSTFPLPNVKAISPILPPKKDVQDALENGHKTGPWRQRNNHICSAHILYIQAPSALCVEYCAFCVSDFFIS